MKRNLKVFLCAALDIGFVLSVSAVAFFSIGKNRTSKLKATGDSYSLNVTGLKSDNTTLQTNYGNDIQFVVDKYASGAFANNGYFKNSTAISGLQSITVNFTTLNADLTISYGWFYDEYYVSTDVINSENPVYEFRGQEPTFFKIENKSGATLKTTSIQLTYSCSESALPEGYTNVQYTLANDGLSYYVSGYNSGIKRAVILSEYKDLPVKSLGNYAFSSCSSLVSIELPDSIETIGEFAFQGCSSLSSVVLPNNLKTIDRWAFYETYLTSIDIPNSVTSINDYAFGRSYLTTVVIPENLESIGVCAFTTCQNLTTLVLSNATTIIGNYAFSNCPLAKVFYKGTEQEWDNISIGTNNTSLSKSIVEFESSVNEYTHVKTDKLSYDVTATNDVSNLVVLDKTVSTFDFAFELPGKNIISLGASAFYNCLNLVSLSVPDGVVSIGSYAFGNCKALRYVTLPNSVYLLGSDGFHGDNALESVTLSTNLSVIRSNMFYDCWSLASVIIPDKVTAIEEGVFSFCYSFTSVLIPKSVSKIGNSIFSTCPLALILYKGTATEWSEISIGSSNNILNECTKEYETSVTTIDHVSTASYSYDVTNDSRVFGFKLKDYSVTSFDFETELPGLSVISLARYAFHGCNKNLRYIVLPNTLVSIGQEAFQGCYLSAVVIPDTLLFVGYGAFSYTPLAMVFYKGLEVEWSAINIQGNNERLQNAPVEFETDVSSFTHVENQRIAYDVTNDNRAFSFKFNDTSASSIDFAAELPGIDIISIKESGFNIGYYLNSIVLPNTVVSIGTSAFYGNYLTSIYIPNSVVFIDSFAFYSYNQLTIYCEAESKPDGWDGNWNSSNLPVVWGYNS